MIADPELLLTLAALALVDSVSVGTLLIPVMFLIAPRLRPGRMLVYLATISVFYLAVGVAVTVGAASLPSSFDGVLETPAAAAVQLIIGAVMLGGGIVVLRRASRAAPDADSSAQSHGRVSRWRDAALAGPSVKAVVGIAVVAGLIELATMVPYLAAITMLSSSGVDPVGQIGLLAVYCALMVLPAGVLLVLRVCLRSRVEPRLKRLAAWIERTGAENTAWVLIIVGGLLARDGAQRFGLVDRIGDLLALL